MIRPEHPMGFYVRISRKIYALKHGVKDPETLEVNVSEWIRTAKNEQERTGAKDLIETLELMYVPCTLLNNI